VAERREHDHEVTGRVGQPAAQLAKEVRTRLVVHPAPVAVQLQVPL
jgi:hypothetical protein